MVIYTDKLNPSDLEKIADNTPPLRIARPIRLVDGDRKRRRIEGVVLRAHSLEEMKRRGITDRGRKILGDGQRSPMGGRYGSRRQYATYEEHGYFMARVFAADSEAEIRSAVATYKGEEDFHEQTAGEFRRLPEGKHNYYDNAPAIGAGWGHG